MEILGTAKQFVTDSTKWVVDAVRAADAKQERVMSHLLDNVFGVDLTTKLFALGILSGVGVKLAEIPLLKSRLWQFFNLCYASVGLILLAGAYSEASPVKRYIDGPDFVSLAIVVLIGSIEFTNFQNRIEQLQGKKKA